MRRAELSGSGHSLWLLPQPETQAAKDLNALIPAIAKKCGTPSFAAHATLIGSVKGDEDTVRAKTAEIAAQLAPYELIGLGGLGSIPGVLHRTLFARVLRTNAVVRAFDIAQKVFGAKSPNDTHFSLAYGGLSPADIAEAMQFAMERNRRIAHTRFEVSAIELWRTEGTVPGWHRVDTFPFGKKKY